MLQKWNRVFTRRIATRAIHGICVGKQCQGVGLGCRAGLPGENTLLAVFLIACPNIAVDRNGQSIEFVST